MTVLISFACSARSREPYGHASQAGSATSTPLVVNRYCSSCATDERRGARRAWWTNTTASRGQARHSREPRAASMPDPAIWACACRQPDASHVTVRGRHCMTHHAPERSARLRIQAQVRGRPYRLAVPYLRLDAAACLARGL
jgi:hypothetical protein